MCKDHLSASLRGAAALLLVSWVKTDQIKKTATKESSRPVQALFVLRQVLAKVLTSSPHSRHGLSAIFSPAPVFYILWFLRVRGALSKPHKRHSGKPSKINLKCCKLVERLSSYVRYYCVMSPHSIAPPPPLRYCSYHLPGVFLGR